MYVDISLDISPTFVTVLFNSGLIFQVIEMNASTERSLAADTGWEMITLGECAPRGRIRMQSADVPILAGIFAQASADPLVAPLAVPIIPPEIE